VRGDARDRSAARASSSLSSTSGHLREEALIAEAKRNATVTMITDGVLMRLNKQDFREP
jgi:CRP-like cAMP-binding protein